MAKGLKNVRPRNDDALQVDLDERERGLSNHLVMKGVTETINLDVGKVRERRTQEYVSLMVLGEAAFEYR
jgi:hypothetical protein